jgi:polyhydroxybutyrate depolymerase
VSAPVRTRVALLLAALVIVAAACSDDGPETAATTEPPGCAPARAAEPGTATRTTTHDDLDRSYELTIPAAYDGITPVPLVLNLHGFGSDGAEENDYTRMPDAAGARGYVVVAPDGGPLSVPSDSSAAADASAYDGMPFWNFFGSGGVTFGPGTTVPGLATDASQLGADDVGFLSTVVADLSAELCIDEERIYSTGMSNGAGMTTTLGCELGDTLAAIAPVSGVNLSGTCPGDAPMPVLAIHGDADDAVHYDGNFLLGFELGNPSVPDRMDQWAARNGCAADPATDAPAPDVVRTTWSCDGADTELWTVTGGGHVWPAPDRPAPDDTFDATEVILDFFDAHAREDAETG